MQLWSNTLSALSRRAARRAGRLELHRPKAAERWLRLACRLAPQFDLIHRDLCAHFRRLNDRLAALAAAQAAAARFESSVDALMLLGESFLGAFRPRDALVAFERALAIEERAEAAMAAGELYA